jgi:hypothetical protein
VAGRSRLLWAVVLIAVLALFIAACSGGRQAQPTPVPTATAAPVVLATAVPTAPPTPIPPTAVPPTAPPPPTATVAAALPPLYVANTGADGLTLRREPGGERIDGLADGTAVTPTGQERQASGRLWREVKDAQGRTGWVAADFLSSERPQPQAAPTAVVSAPTATSTRGVVAAPATATTAPPAVIAPVPPVVQPPVAAATPTRPPAAVATATRPPAAVASTATPRPPVAAPPPAAKPAPVACCKRCTTGIACGDTCISASRNCRVGAGCACNGLVEPGAPDLMMREEEFLAEAVVLEALNLEATPCEVYASVEGVE